MKMGRRPLGQKSGPWANDRVFKYQHAVIDKVCIECTKPFRAIRRLKPICSEACKAARRGKFRPQTFRDCGSCGKRFGPVDHLAVRFCSYSCKVAAQSTGRRVMRKTIPKARAAQRMLAYHVQTGKLIRPKQCEQCRAVAKIEGAHFNYDEPLRVRWLCRSCHIRWDKADPKQATYRVPI